MKKAEIASGPGADQVGVLWRAYVKALWSISKGPFKNDVTGAGREGGQKNFKKSVTSIV